LLVAVQVREPLQGGLDAVEGRAKPANRLGAGGLLGSGLALQLGGRVAGRLAGDSEGGAVVDGRDVVGAGQGLDALGDPSLRVIVAAGCGVMRGTRRSTVSRVADPRCNGPLRGVRPHGGRAPPPLAPALAAVPGWIVVLRLGRRADAEAEADEEGQTANCQSH